MDVQGIGIAVAIVLGILNAFGLGMKVRKDRNSNSNPYKYGERIASLETGLEALKKENEKDHKRIFRLLENKR